MKIALGMFQKPTPVPNLPDDIVEEILLRLPAESICRCRCVCKHWCNLLNNPDFMKIRLKRSIEGQELDCFSIENDNNSHEFRMHITKFSSVFEGDHCEYVKMDSPFEDTSLKIEIVASNNGLLLMCSREDFWTRPTMHWLWSPYTTKPEEILIPDNDRYRYQHNIYSVAYGLSHNCDTNHYKIVVATCFVIGCKIQVYASESNSWKTLPNTFPYLITSMYQYMSEVISVCGAFHWIAMRLRSKITCIVSVSIHGENFREVPVTPEIDNNHLRTLGVLGGCLCILGYQTFDKIEVWVKKDYNVTESWTKLFILQRPQVQRNIVGYVKLLWESKNGELLFVTSKGGSDRYYCDLVLYDPVSNNCKATNIQHTVPCFAGVWNIEAHPVGGKSSQAFGEDRSLRRRLSEFFGELASKFALKGRLL